MLNYALQTHRMQVRISEEMLYNGIMSYSKDVVRGFSWHALLRYVSIGLVVGKSFVIARILSPEEFGIFALVTIALGVSEAATETGVNTTIIQSDRSVGYFLNSAWVIAIVRGFLIGLIMLVLGFVLADFFQQPDLLYLIGAISLAPVIKGFINPARVAFHKNLEFFKDSLYRFLLIVVEVIAAVFLTIWLESVFGLVLSVLVTAVFEVLLSFIWIKQWPRFQYNAVRGKQILEQAKGLSLLTLSTYLVENVDDFLIGKLTGTANLGLYHWGYRLGHLPNYDLGKALSHSSLPVFTKIRTNTVRLSIAFKKSMTLLLILTVVTTVPAFFLGPWAISFLLTDEWLGIVPILGWLLLAGFVQAFVNQAYTLFLALNRQRIINTHQISSLIALIPCIVLGSYLGGVVGAAVGLFISRLLLLPYLWHHIRKTLKW